MNTQAEDLKGSCVEHNAALGAFLQGQQRVGESSREQHEEELHRLTCEDAAMGRTAWPVPFHQADTSATLYHPRFAVAQTRPDGGTKVRAVDHLSWAPQGRSKAERRERSVNGQATVNPMCPDTLDVLEEVLGVFRAEAKVTPSLFKADIDAAFRRVAVRREHRWTCGFAYVYKGEIWASRHFACPFGAIGSVNAWEVVGGAIAEIARFHLALPVLRYVDDYFAPERPQLIEHAMCCFRDLVRVLLGPKAIADKKTEHGNPLTILGVDVTVKAEGFSFRPSEGHVRRWIGDMKLALSEGGFLLAGDAAKLAGRLNWGCTASFRRVGRAMMGPIHAQRFSRDGSVGSELRRALRWWVRLLESGMAERRSWDALGGVPLHVFCDASGVDARLGAVCWDAGTWYWSSTVAPSHLVEAFRVRGDRQIMGLELLAVSLAMGSFGELMKNRIVIIHCDNKGVAR